MPIYAEFSGDKEVRRFEVDEDGIIWDPPVPPAQWLVGHPDDRGIAMLRLQRRTTVLLSDLYLARYRSSYSSIVQVDPPPPPQPTSVLGVDLVPLNQRAQSAIRKAASCSDAGDDERAMELLGESGWPVPDLQWDSARQAIQSRRTAKQRERIARVMAALKEKGPGEAQELLDRLLDLDEDDRRMLQRRIRQWPHRVARSRPRAGVPLRLRMSRRKAGIGVEDDGRPTQP